MKKTIWILGDQLTRKHSVLAAADPKRDRVLMVESRNRGAHLRYHKVKLAMVYSAMRHFAEELRHAGWKVDYYELADTADFSEAFERHCSEHKPKGLVMMSPNSWFEESGVRRIAKAAGLPLEFSEPVQFLCSRQEFQKHAAGKKRLLMEAHYRRMRTGLGILVDENGQPEGGRWNLDAENRLTASDWKKAGSPRPSESPRFSFDKITRDVIADVEKFFPEAPGQAEALWLPVTRQQALEALEDFVRNRLPLFGDYEDVMLAAESCVFHSLLSAPINLGLLEPMECVEAAVAALRAGKAPLNGVEGFVRQIIGWREFVNGVYWLKMPEYAKSNGLGADRPLPAFFYTGETDMRCLRLALGELRETAYNHHIQRLMLLGNFLLLAGVSPQESLRWFSEMYCDAFDWVMAANVLGMSLHADGGFMATKPYAASASYISKMSDYCADCAYRPNVKSGPGACPYNLLYWHFYDRHAERFRGNPRTSMMVNSWLKRPKPERQQILAEAEHFLNGLG